MALPLPAADGAGAPAYGWRPASGDDPEPLPSLRSEQLYDATFRRAVWRLCGGAKGLVVWCRSELDTGRSALGGARGGSRPGSREGAGALAAVAEGARRQRRRDSSGRVLVSQGGPRAGSRPGTPDR